MRTAANGLQSLAFNIGYDVRGIELPYRLIDGRVGGNAAEENFYLVGNVIVEAEMRIFAASFFHN